MPEARRSDGGPGPDAVARLLLGVRGRQPDLSIATATVNGETGLVATDASGAVLAVTSLGVAGGRADRLWVMRNPAKLTAWRRDG